MIRLPHIILTRFWGPERWKTKERRVGFLVGRPRRENDGGERPALPRREQ